MSTESEPTITRVTVILDTASNWHDWIFLREDQANRNVLWLYCNPELSKTEVLRLVEPVKPAMDTHHNGATKLSHLSAEEKEGYKWEYSEWKEAFTEWRRLSKVLEDFNSDITDFLARKHLHLLRRKTGPHERLVSLCTHLGPPRQLVVAKCQQNRLSLNRYRMSIWGACECY
jgi:hypothetical protein